MAKQLTNRFLYKGGYVDSIQSVTDFEALSAMSRSEKFVGLSTTVLKGIVNSDGEFLPVDVWLSETRNSWVLKNIPPIDDLVQLDTIPEELIPKGFEVSLKSGEKYVFQGIDEENKKQWVANISRDELNETVSNAVKNAIDNVKSGATEAFDTLKEIEDWIRTSGSTSGPGKDGITPKFKIENGFWFVSYNEGETWEELGKATGDQGLQGEQGSDGASAYQIWLDAGNNGSEADFLASLKGEQGEKGALDEEQISNLKEEIKSYTDEEIDKIQIPSLEGYATETFVKNAIVDAQLSGNTQIDLSGYATKDDIENLASKDDIKVYSSGTGVSIVDNKINVLIESGDNENRNYIKVNEDNSLSVEEIGLDDAVTTEDIQVNGGAWASAIQDIYGDTIPVGTSFQDFLKAMSCKEYFVSAISVSSSFTVTCGDLKPVLSGANSGDIVEVGTKVILKTINGTETKASQSITLSGFEYGYKLGENGNYINSKTYTEIPIAIISGETGNKSLRVSFTKFASEINGGAISVKTGQNSIEQTTMYVQEGQNNVYISQTGDTYSSNTNLTGGTLYIATNLKNYYKSDKSTPNTYVPTFPLMTKTATISYTYNITGARKYYIGDITEYSNNYWNTDKNSVILGLEKQDWVTGDTITVPYTFKMGTKQQTVVVPDVYTNVSGKDANNGPVDFLPVRTITLINSKGNKSQYNVFVGPAYDGLTTDSLINITIKKS